MSQVNKQAPAFLKGAKKPEASEDKLEALKKMVRQYRDTRMEVNAIMESAAEKSKVLKEAKEKTIPEFMERIGVPSITIEAEGNYPAYVAERKPFYSAGIRADWPPEMKEEGFAYVESLGYGELIKTFVTFPFPRELQAAVVPFLKACKGLKLTAVVEEPSKKPGGKPKRVKKTFSLPLPEVERTIHAGTLTKWLREQVEDAGFMPKLDKIGGFVGTIADVKEVKEKKPRANRSVPK